MCYHIRQIAYVSGELELILLVLGDLDGDAGPHVDLSYDLLANEVTDLNLICVGLLVLLDVDVDGETARWLASVREVDIVRCSRELRWKGGMGNSFRSSKWLQHHDSTPAKCVIFRVDG